MGDQWESNHKEEREGIPSVGVVAVSDSGLIGINGPTKNSSAWKRKKNPSPLSLSFPPTNPLS